MQQEIITHSETFHSDEVMATAILHQILGRDLEVTVTRTRDMNYIKEKIGAAFIIDVGGVYNPDSFQFDHHQKSFNDTYSNDYTIPLSSCGLIYKHFAEELLKTDDQMVIDGFYERFILPIDANDNGVGHIKSEKHEKDMYNYKYNLTLISTIKKMNHPDVHSEEQKQRFDEAVMFCLHVLRVQIEWWLKECQDYQENLDRFLASFNGRKHPEIMEMEDTFGCGSYLREYDPNHVVKYIVLPRDDKGNWQVWTIKDDGIVTRVISQEQARNHIGSDLIFVHKARFIGATKSKDSAKRLAELSLKDHHKLRNKLNRFYYRNRGTFRSAIKTASLVGFGMCVGWTFFKMNLYAGI